MKILLIISISTLALLLFQINAFAFDCPNEQVNEEIVTPLGHNTDKKIAIVEIENAEENSKNIAENLRNMIITRILENNFFEKVYMKTPEDKKKESLIIKLKVATVTDANAGEGKRIAMGLLFGAVGYAIALSARSGTIIVQAELHDAENEKLLGSTVFSSTTGGGTSTGNVPYQSIVCLSKAITDFSQRILSNNKE